MENSIENRNYLFDNFKGILIFLVVFGHFIENFQYIWNSGYTRVAWQFIYLFHMPGFAFVSGHFSKKNDHRIFEKVLAKQIIPLVTFQFAYEIFNKILFHSFTGATFSLTPYWTLWYLLSLAFWRIFFQMLYRIRFIFIISVILALGVGTVTSIGYPLSISRTLVLFPFFLAGNYFKEKEIIEKLKNSKIRFVCFFMSAIILSVAFVYVWKMRFPNGLYLNSYSYKSCDFSWKKGGFYRLVNLTLAFLCIISLLLLTPTKRMLVSEIGRNSMIPYIAHGFLLRLFSIHKFELYKNLYFTFIGGFIFSFLVVYLFGKDKISSVYDKIMTKIVKIVVKAI